MILEVSVLVIPDLSSTFLSLWFRFFHCYSLLLWKTTAGRMAKILPLYSSILGVYLYIGVVKHLSLFSNETKL